LLDSFRRGEGWAIERVYREYVGQVVGLLRKGFSFMSGGQVMSFSGFSDAWELECAVQDSFIQAFSPAARQAYDGVQPFGPYLMTIARNRVISTLRSESREQRRRTALAAEGQPVGPESPERQAMRRELEQVVARFRDTLPPKLLLFFDTRYAEDRNLMETARRLGLSRMKARIRDQKVRQRFVSYLRKQGHLLSGKVPHGLLLLVMKW